MDIRVREATLEDIGKLLTFEQGVIEAERPFDPTLKPGHINYYDLPHLITSEDSTLAVAELNGEIIASGYARVEEPEAFLKHDKLAYLGFMFVDPDYRGRGINRLIIEYLIKWANAKNIFEIRLEVYVENLAAIKAYEKLGFSKHILKMRLDSSPS